MTRTGQLLMSLLTLPLFASPVSGTSTDTNTTRQQINNGEALFLELPCSADTCRAQINEESIPVFAHPKNKNLGLVILAGRLDAEHTTASVQLFSENEQKPITTICLESVEPDYPVEPLSVDPDLVTPPAHARARINRERDQISSALTPLNQNQPLSTPFTLPVPLKKVTSPFGIRRLYNEQLKGRHTGVDLRAAEGTPVRAPHAGVVRMAQFNWYTGGHIIIEHGWGVSSSYFHLSEMQVAVGDTVEQGQQIALTGATGRVTGPHLHWGIHVNDTPVNPLQLLADTEKLFLSSELTRVRWQ